MPDSIQHSMEDTIMEVTSKEGQVATGSAMPDKVQVHRSAPPRRPPWCRSRWYIDPRRPRFRFPVDIRFSWLVVVLDGESQLSEHPYGAGLPALEITGGQPLACGE